MQDTWWHYTPMHRYTSAMLMRVYNGPSRSFASNFVSS
jgi:hypothetical protein